MRIILWGLRTQRNSFRYIWQGFFDNFQRLGYETIWVDDDKKNLQFVTRESLVFAVNVAAKNLKPVKGTKYVLHNIANQNFIESSQVINLQVFTKAAYGESLGSQAILWDQESRTLYQPWGIPEDSTSWLKPSSKGNIEYWVGAVWNNENNQGNLETIIEYREILSQRNIKFRRVGGTKWFTRNGVSSNKSLNLINQSPIGASIVGNWQKENSYVPCRFFKNIAAGAPPTSNLDLSEILRIDGNYKESIKDLVDGRINQTLIQEIEMVNNAQTAIKIYSYENNINRILKLL
jgi:hypothetical protein